MNKNNNNLLIVSKDVKKWKRTSLFIRDIKIGSKIFKNDFKKNIFYFIFLFIMLVITIFSTLITLTFGLNFVSIQSNNPRLELDRATVSSVFLTSIPPKKIEELSNAPGARRVILGRDFNIKLKDFDLILKRTNTRIIDGSDFFKNRLAENKFIEGGFLENKNDVILSEYIINKLNIDNPIGKEIEFFNIAEYDAPRSFVNNVSKETQATIHDSISPIPQKLKIVGINKLDDSDDEGFSYLRTDLIRDLALDSENTIPENKGIFWNEFNNGTLKQSNNFDISEFNLNTDRVKKDYSLFPFLNENKSAINIRISTKFAELNPVFQNTNFLTGSNIYIRLKNKAFYANVVGVFESEKSEIKISKLDLMDFAPNRFIQYLNVYFNSQTSVNSYIRNFSRNGIKISGEIIGARQDHDLNIPREFYWIPALLAFILFVITFGVFGVFIFFRIRRKKHDLHVLNSLGSNRKQLIIFYNLDILFFALSLLVGMFIIYYPFAAIFFNSIEFLNSFYLEPQIVFSGITLLWLIFIIPFILFNWLATYFSTFKYKKK